MKPHMRPVPNGWRCSCTRLTVCAATAQAAWAAWHRYDRMMRHGARVTPA